MAYWIRNDFFRSFAMTEESMLARKIFLQNVAIEITETQLRQYLGGIGELEELQLFVTSSGHSKFGHATFKYHDDLPRVLKPRKHFINGCSFCVELYYSWGQPDVKRLEPLDPDSPLMKINEDCLFHIYRYLSLKDQLNLARACKRCPPVKRILRVEELVVLTTWEMRDYLKYFGCHLTEVSGHMQRSKLLCELLGSYCYNLRSLTVMDTRLTKSNLNDICQKTKDLESLYLWNCWLTDKSILELNKLPNLKTVNLSYNYQLGGTTCHLLPGCLESLNISFCENLNLKLLPKICKYLSHLKHLELTIVGTYDHKMDLFRKIVDNNNGDNLESFKCYLHPNNREYVDLEYVAKFPKLNALSIHYRKRIETAPETMLFEWLVLHKSHQLRYLQLEGVKSLGTRQAELVAQLKALDPNNKLINLKFL